MKLFRLTSTIPPSTSLGSETHLEGSVSRSSPTIPGFRVFARSWHQVLSRSGDAYVEEAPFFCESVFGAYAPFMRKDAFFEPSDEIELEPFGPCRVMSVGWGTSSSSSAGSVLEKKDAIQGSMFWVVVDIFL